MFTNPYRYLFILLLAVYSYLNILFTEGDKLFGFRPSPLLFFGIILGMVYLIWEGNRLIEKRLSILQSIRVHPLLKFYLISLFWVLMIGFAVTGILQITHQLSEDAFLTLKLSLGFAFRVNLFLHCVNAIVYFMNQSRVNQLEKEGLLKETAEARFEALRNQVNPHFLFNSFNVLNTLVHKDPDTASKFIQQLSKVYRYLLNNQTSKVVPLKSELEFLDAYIFLLKIRFGENLQIQNEIENTVGQNYIAPATLQMLIENAIKHNIVSKADPLQIRLFRNGEYYVVENNVQLKPVPEESTNTGLRNIRQRYEFLCGENAVIVQSDGKFVVKIPILDVEDENSNR
ncbi:sensor histidine kinase [Fulvivirga sedimenti]|uniref:Histidine kinase n=1 Tax=Fulvivirga sedimenti TaxID=2879465 RepID=A0A9X1HTE7_9BACT|nr:histidine kinase [Fulvivirga sedimenti]MCA6074917.1 histidine kinase [Fulvivirga sedimenti]MCA6076094.1 histidine kinase [Fulvivirga sedimenti]MCA6077222.1 histidine kinase [Fulvivirga sedimenti]